MTGVIKVNKLEGRSAAGSIIVTGEGNSNTINLQQGLTKHWSSWTQVTTTTVADSFNQSSLTDEGAAYTTIAFTNNMNNNDYAYSGCCQGSGYGQTVFCEYLTSNKLTSATQVRTLHNTSNANSDPDDVMMHTHGDLA